MNRLTCTLLSGASIVALMFGGDLAKGISAKAAPANAAGAPASPPRGTWITSSSQVTTTGNVEVSAPAIRSMGPLRVGHPARRPALRRPGRRSVRRRRHRPPRVAIDGVARQQRRVSPSPLQAAASRRTTWSWVSATTAARSPAGWSTTASSTSSRATLTPMVRFANAVGIAAHRCDRSTTFLNAARRHPLGAGVRERRHLCRPGFGKCDRRVPGCGGYRHGRRQRHQQRPHLGEGDGGSCADASGTCFGYIRVRRGGRNCSAGLGDDSAVATAFFSNGGVLNVTADASAVAIRPTPSASANAIGFSQFASGDPAVATFINDGTINVIGRCGCVGGRRVRDARYAFANGGLPAGDRFQRHRERGQQRHHQRDAPTRTPSNTTGPVGTTCRRALRRRTRRASARVVTAYGYDRRRHRSQQRHHECRRDRVLRPAWKVLARVLMRPASISRSGRTTARSP